MAEYLTISTLTRYLKRKFTADPYLKQVAVTGEVSNFRRRSGHQYFSLKDDQAVINATMFRGVFDKLPFELQAGMKVNAIGHVDLYAPNGSYSLIIERLEPDGIGALYQAYEQLKQRLEAAGMFTQRQAPLPRFPQKLAVITSASGAVIQDIVTTVARRYPIAQIDLYPAVVQGDGAIPSLLARIEQVRTSSQADVVIIGRGGGSLEDLWAFNDEQVAQAVLALPMPVISSVGHETDTTILDYVADHRAPTPTAAAELATPVPLRELWQGIQTMEGRVVQRTQQQVLQAQQHLQKLQQSYVLQQPQRLYEGVGQRVDLATRQLERELTQRLAQERRDVMQLNERLEAAMQRELIRKQEAAAKATAQLDLVSPLAVLGRGYGIIKKADQVVRQTSDVTPGDQVTLWLADGQVAAEIKEAP